MIEKTISLRNAFSYAWGTVKARFWFFVGVTVVYMVLTCICEAVAYPYEKTLPRFYKAMDILSWIVEAYFILGYARFCLRTVDGERAGVADLFSGAGRFFTNVLASLLLLVLLVALVVPAYIGENMAWRISAALVATVCCTYVVLRYCVLPYVIMDSGIGPVAALRRSAALTRGVRWQLLLGMIAAAGIAMLGLLCLLLGFLVAMPVIGIAIAHVYRQLTWQQAQAERLDASTPPAHEEPREPA